MIPIYFAVFFLAASFVSFFNLFDERRRRGEEWIRARSHCDACGRPIPWPYLIPVFGYFLAKGRCICGERISPFHPLTEAIGGILVVFLCLNHGMDSRTLFWIAGIFILYLLAVEDCRHRDVYTRDLIVGGMIFALALFFKNTIYPLSGLFILLIMGVLYLLFPKAVGEGDIYYATVLALGIEGIWNSYLFFTCAFVTAAVVGGGLFLLKLTKERAFPMFPFFLWAYVIVENFLL